MSILPIAERVVTEKQKRSLLFIWNFWWVCTIGKMSQNNWVLIIKIQKEIPDIMSDMYIAATKIFLWPAHNPKFISLELYDLGLNISSWVEPSARVKIKSDRSIYDNFFRKSYNVYTFSAWKSFELLMSLEGNESKIMDLGLNHV